jgi:hypothetical protein
MLLVEFEFDAPLAVALPLLLPLDPEQPAIKKSAGANFSSVGVDFMTSLVRCAI